MESQSKFKIFALPISTHLGNEVAKMLSTKLSEIEVVQFADGEMLLSAQESVREKDVYVIVSCCDRVNDNLMQLLIFIDSLKRASARSITAVITYYPYARQDRKAQGRQPITAKLVADLVTAAGADRIITIDLHNPSIQGFFDIPVDDLKGSFVMASELVKLGRFTIVSPDHGGAMRARNLAELVANTIQIAVVDKRRIGKNQAEVMNVLGDVQGKNVLIFDDIIDTGGTIMKAVEALKRLGAKKIFVAATHGIFSQGFAMFENNKDINMVIVTDSIPLVRNIQSKKILVTSVAPLISSIIKSSNDGISSKDFYDQIRKTLQS